MEPWASSDRDRGANATTGFDGENPLNPWDIVLMLEGALSFSGALTRSWGAEDSARAAFPFTFEPIAAGAGALSTEDPNPRGELWTPLWTKPSRFVEVRALFAEGRLTLAGAPLEPGWMLRARSPVSACRVGSACEGEEGSCRRSSSTSARFICIHRG
jgi:CRISPR-associated protein Csx17